MPADTRFEIGQTWDLRNVMPFTNLGDLRRFLDEHIERNYVEHYGRV
jgi:hypothetical protein